MTFISSCEVKKMYISFIGLPVMKYTFFATLDEINDIFMYDLFCVQLASYLERVPLMWKMLLHLHVNQNPMMMVHSKNLNFLYVSHATCISMHLQAAWKTV